MGNSNTEINAKTFREEILPLWWTEIRVWFGWTDIPKTIFKTGGHILTIWVAIWLGGKVDALLDSIIVQVIVGLLGILVLPSILFITYSRASNKLYNNRKADKKKLINSQEIVLQESRKELDKKAEQIATLQSKIEEKIREKDAIIADLQQQLEAKSGNKDKPILYSDSPEILEGRLPGTLIDTGFQYQPYLVVAKFYNKPIRITDDSIAEKVHADVTYYDSNLIPIFVISGVWNLNGEWESPSWGHAPLKIKKDLQLLRGHSEVDFRPDSENQQLYLAIRHYGERTTYVIAPPSFEYEYLKHPAYALDHMRHKKCYVHVALRPINSESIDRWYELVNDFDLEINEVEMPKFTIDEYIDENGRMNNHPRIGFLVKNHSNNDIVDCWARLTSMRWILPKSKEFPEEQESQEFINKINPDHLKLSWTGETDQQKEFYVLRKGGGDGIINLVETSEDGHPVFVFFGKRRAIIQLVNAKLKWKYILGAIFGLLKR